MKILDDSGNVIDNVLYEDLAAQGYTLELADPFSDNSNIANWVESQVEGGTPGTVNSQINAVPDLGIIAIILIFGIFIFVVKRY